MSKNHDTHHMHFELTPEQYRALCEKAKLCGLSKRAFLIRCIEGAKLRARPSEELQKLRLEIHYIGVNINQIAERQRRDRAPRGREARLVPAG